VSQDGEKTDYFLIEDANNAGVKFAGLLTNGSGASNGLAKYFGSTGVSYIEDAGASYDDPAAAFTAGESVRALLGRCQGAP